MVFDQSERAQGPIYIIKGNNPRGMLGEHMKSFVNHEPWRKVLPSTSLEVKKSRGYKYVIFRWIKEQLPRKYVGVVIGKQTAKLVRLLKRSIVNASVVLFL